MKYQYLPFSVAAALKVPKVNNGLAERIMTEEEAHAIIAAETDLRNHAIVKLLYHTGLRVRELCALRWENVITRSSGAQLSVLGKGEEKRQVLTSENMHTELLSVKAGDYVILSRKGGPLTEWQVRRIAEAAAGKAGVDQGVSPCWFRHANASHALANGADLLTVRDNHGHASIATTNKHLHARPNIGRANTQKGNYRIPSHSLLLV